MNEQLVGLMTDRAMQENTPDEVLNNTLNADALDAFAQNGFLVLDNALSADLLRDLKTEGGYFAYINRDDVNRDDVDYMDAKLTGDKRAPSIRGDRIRWIEVEAGEASKQTAGALYLAALLAFGRAFNQAFFTNINHAEAHFAYYDQGFGYDWHTDNPQDKTARVLSLVLYLNDDWTAEDGGAITLIDKNDAAHTILPQNGRIVLFDSNLLHKVNVTHKRRYSIAAWLRNDGVY